MGKISMPQGKGSQLHNRRDYEKIGKEFPDNIDQNLTEQNITIVDKDIREAYQEFFGEALQEYNQKQKRADRKIEDYYEHISKSKNGEKLFYEDVLQWGKKEDFQDNPELKEIAKECLKEYAETFEKRNPNLKLIGAYIHMDEVSPHLHLDYVPVAHGYSRGLKTRNSLDKAMKEMGFQPEKESRKNNATRLWKDNERQYFGDLCRNRGLEVEEERHYDRKSLSVEEYKEAKDKMLDEIEQEKGLLEQSIESNKKEIQDQEVKIASNSKALDQQGSELKKIDDISRYLALEGENSISVEDFTISAKKSILGKIEAPERQGTFVEGMDKEQIEALMKKAKATDELERVYDTVQNQCDSMIADAKKQANEILSEATAEKNEKIAKATEVVNQRNSMIQEVKEWAKRVEQKLKDVTDAIERNLLRKKQLETEISSLEAQKENLEPLRAEVEDLTRAKKIMSGELDYELTRAKFKDWSSMPFGSNYDGYRARGELIALYNDGSIRKVGTNEHGGFDNKTLEDQGKKLCRVGIMVDEERVRVPKSLLRELIDSRDREKPLSKGLENLIKQQTEVDRTVSRHRGRER
jgi:hypothetical protein